MSKLYILVSVIFLACFIEGAANHLSGHVYYSTPGQCTGSIDLMINGGYAPYEVTWTTPQGILPPEFSNGNDELCFAPIECIKSFIPLIVKFFENFELDWVIIKKDQSGQEIGRVNIGKTSNKLYVTWGYPILGLNSSFDPKSETFVHHSTIHLSCKNAKDLSNESAIIDKIFDEFNDRDVRKINGTKAMQYWGDGILQLLQTGACGPVCGLFEYENASCGTWTYLMNDMIKIQGIPISEISIVYWNYLMNTDQYAEFMDERDQFIQGDANYVSCLPIPDGNGYNVGFMVND